ncbi:hypothetical protein LAZ67_21000823 [Cordylochernes scorpioides]|uniref:Uncharacterized protein n=1 Tax=Cordylochernes scorpioides TaxID=51811 RepID=A0ABY6LP38_9ARAC|nr:hypothetical protein LAZ67_21000823 [Cordylochernes scorpioides]
MLKLSTVEKNISLVLDDLEKVLTTIIIIDKTWENVILTTIYNCFRKCGFEQTKCVEQSS